MYNLILQFHFLFLILHDTELWLSKLWFCVHLYHKLITNVWLQSTFMPFSCSQVIDETVCFTGYCHNYQVNSMSSKLQFQLRIFYYWLLQETSGQCLELLCLTTFQRRGFIRSFYFAPYLFPLHMTRRPNKDFLIFFLSMVKMVLDTKFFRQSTSGGVFLFSCSI